MEVQPYRTSEVILCSAAYVVETRGKQNIKNKLKKERQKKKKNSSFLFRRSQRRNVPYSPLLLPWLCMHMPSHEIIFQRISIYNMKKKKG